MKFWTFCGQFEEITDISMWLSLRKGCLRTIVFTFERFQHFIYENVGKVTKNT